MIGIELGPGDGTRSFRTSFRNFGAAVQVWGTSGSKDQVSKVGWWTGYLEMHTIVVISHEGERVGGCAAYQIIGDDELHLLVPLGALESLWVKS